MIHEELYLYDTHIRSLYGEILCGVDEAGRGPLAGPVCCAAVILNPARRHSGLNDSKKLTEKTRLRLYHEIINSCICYTSVCIAHTMIDEINILQATLLGMKNAIANLSCHPSIILVDGNRSPADVDHCLSVVKGDSLSASIAAASVIAKVTRDRIMIGLDEQYPGYGFAKNKGYPTKEHYDSIEKLGICPIHRRTFRLFKRTNLQNI